MYSPGERRVCGVYGGCAGPLHAEPYRPRAPGGLFRRDLQAVAGGKEVLRYTPKLGAHLGAIRLPLPSSMPRLETCFFQPLAIPSWDMEGASAPTSTTLLDRSSAGSSGHGLDGAYAAASGQIQVALDNLNTLNPASLYETFEPKEARRIRKRLEFHYTPKHGSWLNMAEIEFSVLARRVLRRRIADEETLSGEIAANWSRQNETKPEQPLTMETLHCGRPGPGNLHHLLSCQQLG